MKSLIISASDKANGSAKAAYRLHQGLTQAGYESQMLVQDKGTYDTHVLAPQSRLLQGVAKARVTIDALPLKLYRDRTPTLMSLQWLPNYINTHIHHKIKPDIINLHWANEAFLPIEMLSKLKVPIVWSLHDMWAFTGGCHYTQGCDRYQQSCGSCPQLGSQHKLDLSRWVWQRKLRTYPRSNLTVVALSQWLGQCAKDSTLFQNTRVKVIPNGIDTQTYRPIEQAKARQLLQLPQDKKLVLFGALKSTSNKRKGFHLLSTALAQLETAGWGDNLEVVVFGASQPEKPPEIGFKIHYLGSFADDLSLALAYSAVDVFVAPSLQENLANTVMESLACGTPCVAFNIGGMPDMITHQYNGYLADPFDVSDLAQGIVWTIEHEERSQHIRSQSRQHVEENFTLSIQAHRYRALFNELYEEQLRAA